MVRRRRDQRDAGLGVAEARDLVGHLVARELAALARLRALGDLDLELVGEGEVLRRDAEAAGCDLLDRRVALGSGSAPGPRRPRPCSRAPPRRLRAIAIVSCASAESAPCDIAPPEKRRTIASAGSTSSSGTAGPRGTSSSRSRGSSGAAVDECREALVELPAPAVDRLPQSVRGGRSCSASTTSGLVACGSPPLRCLT